MTPETPANPPGARRSFGSVVRVCSWRLWILTLSALAVLLLYPPSYRNTRLASLGLSLIVWLGLIVLLWSRLKARLCLIAISLGLSVFLLLPGRKSFDVEALQREYVRRLASYDGVTYIWGGENHLGIDCSGLTRKGLVDALLWRGICTADSGLVRRGLDLWWHDCTAASLGGQYRGITVLITETSSLNTLDPASLEPGDLAVTTSGIHIMAYLGGNRWIEADPTAGRVVTAKVPTDEFGWFDTPMRIVRWKIFAQ